MDDTALPLRQQLFILVMGALLLLAVIELIRKRKLVEKYAILWIILGVLTISLIWLYPGIIILTQIIGSGSTSSTILAFGVFLLLLLNMQLSIKVSDYEFKIKDLVQEIALLSHQIETIQQRGQLNQGRDEETSCRNAHDES